MRTVKDRSENLGNWANSPWAGRFPEVRRIELREEGARVHPKQIEAYRKMTPEQKFEILAKLRATAWELKAAGIRAGHPDWTETQVQEKVREIFLYATT